MIFHINNHFVYKYSFTSSLLIFRPFYFSWLNAVLELCWVWFFFLIATLTFSRDVVFGYKFFMVPYSCFTMLRLLLSLTDGFFLLIYLSFSLHTFCFPLILFFCFFWFPSIKGFLRRFLSLIWNRNSKTDWTLCIHQQDLSSCSSIGWSGGRLPGGDSCRL